MNILRIDRKMIDELAKIAFENPGCAGAKLAAGFRFGKQLEYIGVNKNKSHPFQAKWGKNESSIYLHAEIDAIVNALNFREINDLRYLTLYIVRVHKSGERVLAKPCIGCFRAITAFNIRRVIYTNQVGEPELL